MCEQDYRRTFDPADRHLYNIRFKIWNFDSIDTGLKQTNKNSPGQWNFRLKIHVFGIMGYKGTPTINYRFSVYAN